MLTLCLGLSAAIHGYMQRYMPTNLAVAWLRTPRGLKWAIPAAVVATPAYLAVMVLAMAIISAGGPGWLHLLFLWAFWNSMKFAVMAIRSLPIMAMRALRSVAQPSGR